MSNSENQALYKGIDTEHLSLEDLLLIKGNFTPSEAREVLMSLIRSKISFHKKKNLRSYEHNGSEDHESKERIEELEKMRKQLLMILENADRDGISIKMESDLTIEFLESPE
jgi:hypothetical protein